MAQSVCTSQVAKVGVIEKEELFLTVWRMWRGFPTTPHRWSSLLRVDTADLLSVDVKESERCVFESDTQLLTMPIHPGPKVNSHKRELEYHEEGLEYRLHAGRGDDGKGMLGSKQLQHRMFNRVFRINVTLPFSVRSSQLLARGNDTSTKGQLSVLGSKKVISIQTTAVNN